MKKTIIHDGYNNHLYRGGVIGTVTPLFSRWAKQDGSKILSIMEEKERIKKRDFRIRKLTPRECFRLMDVSEEDIDKIQNAGISNTQQYKLAGNSIVVSVLVALMRQMFRAEYIKPMESPESTRVTKPTKAKEEQPKAETTQLSLFDFGDE